MLRVSFLNLWIGVMKVEKGDKVILKVGTEEFEGVIREIDSVNSMVLVEVKNLWKKIERRVENRYYEFKPEVWCTWYVWDKSAKGELKDLSKWGVRFVTKQKPPLVNVIEIGFYLNGEELDRRKARLLRVERMRKGEEEMYIVAVGFSEELPQNVIDKLVKSAS